MPLPAKAVTGADAPGMAVTGMFFSRQALTIKYPGSEMTGMPASEISAISSPCCKKFRACSNFFSSLWSLKLIRRLALSPQRAKFSPARLVSSASTRGTSSKIFLARGLKSPALPRGVATMWSLPNVLLGDDIAKMLQFQGFAVDTNQIETAGVIPKPFLV